MMPNLLAPFGASRGSLIVVAHRDPATLQRA